MSHMISIERQEETFFLVLDGFISLLQKMRVGQSDIPNAILFVDILPIHKKTFASSH